MLGTQGFNCINANQFYPGTEMKFRQYTGDAEIDLKVFNDTVTILYDNYFDGKFVKGTPKDLKELFNVNVEEASKKVIGKIVNKMTQDYTLSLGKLFKILNSYMLSYKDFKNYIQNSDVYKDKFKFFKTKIYMDIVANQATTINRQKEQEKRGS